MVELLIWKHVKKNIEKVPSKESVYFSHYCASQWLLLEPSFGNAVVLNNINQSSVSPAFGNSVRQPVSRHVPLSSQIDRSDTS